MGQGVVHGRSGQRGGRVAAVCILRDGHTRLAERAVDAVDLHPFWRKPDVEERAGDGRGAGRDGTTRARLAGRQHASRVFAGGHAAARGADAGDRWLAEGRKRVGWDRVWGYERDCAVRRDPRGGKWIAGRLGAQAEQRG